MVRATNLFLATPPLAGAFFSALRFDTAGLFRPVLGLGATVGFRGLITWEVAVVFDVVEDDGEFPSSLIFTDDLLAVFVFAFVLWHVLDATDVSRNEPYFAINFFSTFDQRDEAELALAKPALGANVFQSTWTYRQCT